MPDVRSRTSEDRDRAPELRDALDRTGYYPEVVADAVSEAVGGEHVVSFYVHHEPTFERDEVRRHQSVIVLTPSRLILAHTDEHHRARGPVHSRFPRRQPASSPPGDCDSSIRRGHERIQPARPKHRRRHRSAP